MIDTPVALGQYGLAGIVTILGSVVVALYRDNKKLQEQVVQAQKDRVADNKEVQDKVVVQLELQSKVMDLVYRKLDDAKRGS